MTRPVVSTLFVSLALLALGWLPLAKAGDQVLECGDPAPTLVTIQANEQIVFASNLSYQQAWAQMQAITNDPAIAGQFLFNLATAGISCTTCPFEGACVRYRTSVGDYTVNVFIEGSEGEFDWDVVLDMQSTASYAVLCTDCLNPTF